MSASRTLRCPLNLDLPDVDMTIPEYLVQMVEQHVARGKKEWMIDSVTGTTYHLRDFVETSQNVANWFFQNGMVKGDVLLYMTENFAPLPLIFVGVWKANGIVRSSHPEDTAENFLAKVTESQAKWIYCDEETSKVALSVSQHCSWPVEVIVNGKTSGCTSLNEILKYSKTGSPNLEISSEDVAFILSTSGTTGRSRGVVRTHQSVLNFLLTHNIYPWGNPSLLQFRATHVSGSLIPLGNLAKGVTTVAVWKMAPTFLCDAVHIHRPATVATLPGSLLALVDSVSKGKKYDISSVSTVITGGAHLTQAMRDRIRRGLSSDVLTVYGLSECAAVIVSVQYSSNNEWVVSDPPKGAQGKVAPGKEIQIRDPETSQVIFGPNEIGEICVKSPELFSHYLNNPKATSAAFTADGYFKTRDLGTYDENEFITILGRIDDVFKFENKLVAPDWIDEIVSSHAAVDEVCTISVPHTDQANFIPRTFVTLRPGMHATVEDVVKFAHSRLPDHMHIRGGLFIVPELPRGATGKISRMLLSRVQV